MPRGFPASMPLSAHGAASAPAAPPRTSPRGPALSSDDLEQISRAVEVLVSPFAHDGVDEWRSAVRRLLDPLLGEDAVVFLLSGTGALDGRLLGEREKVILRVLLPAFQAGVEARARCERHRTSFLDTLDHLNEAAMVFAAAGSLLHVTPALSDLLAADPEGEVVCGGMLGAVTAVRWALKRAAAQNRSISRPEAFDLRTSRARYRIHPCVYGAGGEDRETWILIGLQRCSPVPLPDGELREAFGLTPAEIRVARLIAQGRANADIAGYLSISPHTARRHTERVMLKMGLRSRAEVAGKVHG